MKILFPFVGDSVGGSHISTVILIQSLVMIGVEVRIVLHEDNGPLSGYLKLNKLEYDVLSTKYLSGQSPSLHKIIYGVLFNFIKFYSYIGENKITIVHANDLRMNLTWSPIVRFTKAKFLWHQRTLLSSSYFWKLIFYLSDCFVAISATVYCTSPSNIPTSKKHMIYNPIVVNQLKKSNAYLQTLYQKYNINKEATLLGYVGRLSEEWKRVDFLITCIYSLLKTSNYHLLIVGNCDSQYCKKLIKFVGEIKMESKITFIGFIPDPMPMIESLDILIAPSRNEPLGRTLLESMAQKTAVLASNSGGHKEIVGSDRGFLFELDNCDDLRAKIEFIKNNHQLTVESSERGYLYVVENYSPSAHMKNILNLYKSLKV